MKGPLYDSARDTVNMTETIIILKPAFANVTLTPSSCQ